MKYSSAKSPKRAAGLTNATTVLDPLCGVATILIEGKREWPNAVFYGGDIDTTQIDRAVMNVKRSGVDPGDLFIWDCARKYYLLTDSVVITFLSSLVELPFKDNSISAVVSDIPFGKRHGSMHDNRKVRC